MGAFDEAKGKVKEGVGGLTGSDEMREEGQAQQRKGAEEEKAAEARRTADAHEHRAAEHRDAEQDRQGT